MPKVAKGKGNMVKSKTPGFAMDIPGIQVAKQAKKKGSGFKAGGVPAKAEGGEANAAPAVKKKDGGTAEGAAPAPRADKAPRMASGGSMRGRSPFSNASSTSDPYSKGK